MSESNPAHRRAATVTIALCLLAAMIEGFDIQAAGVAATRMRSAFDLDETQMGWMLAASPLGLLVGAAIGGRLADRFGRKAVLIASMATFGLFTIGTALVDTYNHLLVMRLLTGLGLGGALPNLIALTAEAAEAKRRNTLVSLTAAGMPLGGIVPGLLAVAFTGPADWRVIFWVGGVAPLALALVLLAALPESRRFREIAERRAARPPILGALFGEGRWASTAALGIAFFSAFLILYLLQNWLPLLMEDRGFSRPDTGWIQAAFNLGGAIGAVSLGALMDRGGRRAVVLVAWLAIAGALMALSQMRPVLAEAALVGAVAGVFVTGSQLILYGLASGCYATPLRGTGVGFSVALGRIGSIVGPLSAAAILRGGGSASQVLTAMLPVVVVGGLAAFAVTLRPPVAD
jgi:MFS transporter, AAHS family, 3-hydroxyphenylpropionic acid transporter